VRRRIGVADWQREGPALGRQTAILLALLDELDVRATFFVLGMTARSYPALVEEIARRGHEIACHGDQHRPVHAQTRDEFAQDVRAARTTIEGLAGVPPVGYRAPGFSITRAASWAFGVLAAEGFAYDSSQHDSPRIRDRIVAAGAGPHPLELEDGGALWELPPAVWRVGRARLPVGGASYWGVLPTRLVLHGLSDAVAMAGLYLHPHELDPQPLRAELPEGARMSERTRARARAAQRNLTRRRASQVLRAIAGRHRLITYGEAHAELSGGAHTRS
jgi:polysaccharide deacetylase family protein (PEP-CTERM system associated)